MQEFLISSTRFSARYKNLAERQFCRSSTGRKNVEGIRALFVNVHIYLNARRSMDGIAIRNDAIIFFFFTHKEAFVRGAGPQKRAIRPYIWNRQSRARAPSRFFIINNCCSPFIVPIALSLCGTVRNNYKNVSLAMRSRLVTCIINETPLNACCPDRSSIPFSALASRFPLLPLRSSRLSSTSLMASPLSRRFGILLSLYTLRYAHLREETSGRVKLASLRRIRQDIFRRLSPGAEEAVERY